MPIDVETLFTGQLENLIVNHRRKRATNAPLHIDALRELEKRKGKGLDFEKSLSIILEAAREARFLSYRELADANGADWSQVRYAIGGHLWKLAEHGHLKERLLLSAIVVNKPNVETGKMEPDTLKGFIGAARELGYPITDEQAFLKEQQARVFAWARGGIDSAPIAIRGASRFSGRFDGMGFEDHSELFADRTEDGGKIVHTRIPARR